MSEGSIEICGVPFELSFTGAGISALKLPPLDETIKAIPATVRPRVVVTCSGGGSAGRALLEEAGRYLCGLLSGRPGGRAPAADLRGLGVFTVRVLGAVSEIAWGDLDTYAGVAGAAGVPRGARAAGQAVARNPVPLLVPCHRVVRSDGCLGGWSGAPGWKEWLLRLEGTLERAGGPPAGVPPPR